MKKILLIALLYLLAASACSLTSGEVGTVNQPPAAEPQYGSEVENGDSSEQILQPIPLGEDSAAECLTGEVHPIGVSIAEQYAEITNYDEVMGWFCQGALFEDILNALMTEELVGVNAGDVLLMVSDGQSWEEIWLELGVTE